LLFFKVNSFLGYRKICRIYLHADISATCFNAGNGGCTGAKKRVKNKLARVAERITEQSGIEGKSSRQSPRYMLSGSIIHYPAISSNILHLSTVLAPVP